MGVESEYCYFRPFGPTNSEFRPLVAIGVFSPLNFKNYLLFEFRSYRKSNELRLKPLKNYIDLTHQKFKVLRFQKVDRLLNFLHIQIYALRWWLLQNINFEKDDKVKKNATKRRYF